MAGEGKVRGRVITDEVREIAKGQVVEGPVSHGEQIWLVLEDVGIHWKSFEQWNGRI